MPRRTRPPRFSLLIAAAVGHALLLAIVLSSAQSEAHVNPSPSRHTHEL